MAIRVELKRQIRALEVLIDSFEGSSLIRFQGDLCAIDWATVANSTVHRTSDGVQEAVLPLVGGCLHALKSSVLPRIGLNSRVHHVIIERGGQRVFAAYDSFHPECTLIDAPEADEIVVRLQEAGCVASIPKAD